jgi:hypothetical protein
MFFKLYEEDKYIFSGLCDKLKEKNKDEPSFKLYLMIGQVDSVCKAIVVDIDCLVNVIKDIIVEYEIDESIFKSYLENKEM